MNSLSAVLPRFVLTVLALCVLAPTYGRTPPHSRTASPPTSPNPFDYCGGLAHNEAVPAPSSVLGHPIGAQFSRHHDVLAYCEALAEASDRVRLEEYGRTWEDRPLVIMTISSPANLARLDEILARHRELADPRATSEPRAAEIARDNPAVVWLSYNVHGNEASSTEAAMQVAYTLASATNDEVQRMLDRLVVVIDPCLNPDGRERYVSWYRQRLGVSIDADPLAAEHDEPWPGGRANHYLFDLNRDWIWGVHPESRARINAYRRFLPVLHIDYHEQEYTSPYFFGAGEPPYNLNIPQETKDWIEKYGKANAEVFDANRLVYATKERFDYLYPGYGKVTPVYYGAIGMLCEQAGHGFAGLAVNVHDHYALTLQDRARNHFLTSLSYLESTAEWREEQLQRFARYFRESIASDGKPHAAYLIDARTDPSLLRRTWDLCSAHAIEVHALDADTTIAGAHSYKNGGAIESLELPLGSWVIRTDQPMGRLVRALFERTTEVESIDTYDIAAWSLPVAFGLRAAWSDSIPDTAHSLLSEWTPPAPAIDGVEPDKAVAIIVDAAQHAFPAAVGAASKHDLYCRAAGDPIVYEGRTFARGSLIVHSVRNDPAALRAFESDLLALGLSAHRSSSGFPESGPVLGTNKNSRLESPRVLLLASEPVSSLSYGEIWNLLDNQCHIPHTRITAETLARADISGFNTLVIPSVSSLSGALGESGLSRLKDWVRAGGCVIAMDDAGRWASRTLLELKDDSEPKDDRPKASELSYEQRRERSVEDRVPGTMLRVDIDMTHPLAAGVPEWVGVVKRGAGGLPVADSGSVIARFAKEPRIGGPISDRNIERLAGKPFLTHHRLGRGSVICFADDVTLRGFNHASSRLLLNAIVFGPSM